MLSEIHRKMQRPSYKNVQHRWTECNANGEQQHEQGVRRGEPLHLHQDVSATRLPGGLETTLQVTPSNK